MAEPKKKESGGTQFRYIGDHAEILDSGVPVGVGEYVTLTSEQAVEPVAKALIEAGKLIDASDFNQGEPEAKNEGSGE